MRVAIVNIILCCLLPSISVCQQSVMLTTTQGNITGYTVYPDSPVYHFYGIPYAKPPKGDMRWKRPIAEEPWDGVFNATSQGELGVACIQKLTTSRKFYNISEDCLQLNIYTSNVQEAANKQKKAVMFFIHGGGFSKGSAREYEGEHLTRRGDIVLVTINYRLSILGFFDSDGDNVWENLGLWDIKLALQWVQQNIESFGGDKNRVTIFGGSAGGMITSLLASSQEFNGLFRRVISESGNHLCPKMLYTSAEDVHNDVLKEVDCEDTECLKKASADKIIDAAASIDYRGFTFPVRYTFAAFRDDVILTADQFEVWRFYRDGSAVSNSSRSSAASTFLQYDFLSGINTQEGSLLLSTLRRLAKEGGFSLEEGANKNAVDIFLDEYMSVYFPLSLSKKKESFLSMFFDGVNLEETPSPEVAQKLINLYTDLLFGAPTLALLDSHCTQKSTSTYMYTFNYMTDDSRSAAPSWFKGAPHTEERVLLFGEWPAFYKSRGQLNMTKEEKRLADELMDTWSNFAKTGNPNGEELSYSWKPYSVSQQHYKGFGGGEVDVSAWLYNMRRVQAQKDIKPAIPSGATLYMLNVIVLLPVLLVHDI